MDISFPFFFLLSPLFPSVPLVGFLIQTFLPSYLPSFPLFSTPKAPNRWLANPVLPEDILKEAVPGSIRRAEHFLSLLRRLLDHLSGRLLTSQVESEGPLTFLRGLSDSQGVDPKTLRFCYDRLQSLLLTLEISEVDEFLPLHTVCDFATLVGTYSQGFSLIIEPFDERMPHLPDPVIQVHWGSTRG